MRCTLVRLMPTSAAILIVRDIAPVSVPSPAAAIVALLLSRRQAAPLAYISGSLGRLMGADLINLYKIPGIGSPVASIGGAGTFDGVFLIAVLAVLIASISAGNATSNP